MAERIPATWSKISKLSQFLDSKSLFHSPLNTFRVQILIFYFIFIKNLFNKFQIAIYLFKILLSYLRICSYSVMYLIIKKSTYFWNFTLKIFIFLYFWCEIVYFRQKLSFISVLFIFYSFCLKSRVGYYIFL